MPIATRLLPPAPQHEQRRASTDPTSFDPADNSFEVVWSTGAAVTRFDWHDGGYVDETLSLDASAVRLERLNNGGPVLNSHNMFDLGALVGSVVPGSVRLAASMGTCRVRLSDSDDVAAIIAKIRGGHLRSVSVGYRVHAYERIERPGQRDELRAVDWEPLEISLVSVPADAGANIRSMEDTMPEAAEIENEGEGAQRQPSRVTVDAIRRACARTDHLSRAFERELIERHEERPLTVRELRQAINDELLAVQATPIVNANHDGGAGDTVVERGGRGFMARDRIYSRGSAEGVARQLEDVLFARMTGGDVPAEAERYRHLSLVDMMRYALEARGVSDARWLAPSTVVSRYGAHTTGDFPVLTQDAGTRLLVTQLEALRSPLVALAKPLSVNDFRASTSIVVSGAPPLLLVPENAEFTHGTIGMDSVAYKVSTYGRLFALTRQAIINDDLGAFAAAIEAWAGGVADLERAFLISLLTTGPLMSDGQPLFHADHGNLAGSGGAISVASLSAGREAMRKQKGIEGRGNVQAVPKYLVVGPAKETEAEQALADLNAQQASDVNPFAGKLTLVVENDLVGNAWYLMADPARNPVMGLVNLRGAEQPFVDSRTGFEVDGVQHKIRHDLGAVALDWRGAYKNPGNS